MHRTLLIEALLPDECKNSTTSRFESGTVNLAYYGLGIESLYDEDATPPPKPSPTHAPMHATSMYVHEDVLTLHHAKA